MCAGLAWSLISCNSWTRLRSLVSMGDEGATNDFCVNRALKLIHVFHKRYITLDIQHFTWIPLYFFSFFNIFFIFICYMFLNTHFISVYFFVGLLAIQGDEEDGETEGWWWEAFFQIETYQDLFKIVFVSRNIELSSHPFNWKGPCSKLHYLQIVETFTVV